MRKISVVLFLITILVIPKHVNALTGNLEITCDKSTITVGEKSKCTLYGNSSEEVAAVEATLSSVGDIKISDVLVSSIWKGDYENKSLLLYTDTNKTNKFELISFNVSSDEVGSNILLINNSKFTDSSFVRNNVQDVTYTFNVVSKDDGKNETIIIPDDNKTSDSKNESEEENPKTGVILPITLILVILGILPYVFIKVRKRKIYKI